MQLITGAPMTIFNLRLPEIGIVNVTPRLWLLRFLKAYVFCCSEQAILELLRLVFTLMSRGSLRPPLHGSASVLTPEW